MTLPSQALVLDLACLWPGWRAVPVRWDTRGSFASAAPPGTGERRRASGRTAPACLACAMGTARRANLRRVSRADKTGSSKRLFFLGWLMKQKPCPSLFQACAIAGITRRGLTVRSAVMGITETRQRARPQTASPAHAQAARAVPSCPAQKRWCAPAARLALQVCSYTKSLFNSTPHVPVEMCLLPVLGL